MCLVSSVVNLARTLYRDGLQGGMLIYASLVDTWRRGEDVHSLVCMEDKAVLGWVRLRVRWDNMMKTCAHYATQ